MSFSAWTLTGSPLGSFKAWRASIPEIKALQLYVRHQPTEALEYSLAIQSSPATFSSCLEDVDLAIAHRCGKVLTAASVLLQHATPLHDAKEHSILDDQGIEACMRLPVLRAPGRCIIAFAAPCSDTFARLLEDELFADSSDTHTCILDVREELVRVATRSQSGLLTIFSFRESTLTMCLMFCERHAMLSCKVITLTLLTAPESDSACALYRSVYSGNRVAGNALA